ncbi:hypothetical protein PG990_001455 [Apiospora arundinis]|uniref:Uncharacterized protein n=1 Tax=Apiospora arundinis TaxID=335852 RepID=A0ABR2I248_9PEZI
MEARFRVNQPYHVGEAGFWSSILPTSAPSSICSMIVWFMAIATTKDMVMFRYSTSDTMPYQREDRGKGGCGILILQRPASSYWSR